MTKILVIEDQTVLRQEILDMLQFEGFECFEAENGLDGIKTARAKLPDLIICDILMPKLDGYGVLYELRSDAATALIPFIFLTAKTEATDLRVGMDMGADDYLTKPFTFSELLSAINTRLQKHSLHMEASEQKLEALREHVLLALPHEMRTPLTAILGYSQLLADSDGSMSLHEVTHTGQVIYKAALRLHHQIENYLAYIQIGLIQQEPRQLALLRESITRYPAEALVGRARYCAEAVDRLDDLQLKMDDIPSVYIFTEYLNKIAEELVWNAFKFSPSGTPVTLSAYEHNNHYVIQVHDQGRGMTPEQIQAVGAYIQFDRKLHEQQGSGMGLIIVKQLTELHGGRFSIESSPGHGTIVTVSLRAVLN